MATNLTSHFTLEELVFSSTAERLGIKNQPSAAILENLKVLAAGLEQVRGELGAPMHIDSGFRCPELNAAVKGAAKSAHLDGFAADFVSNQFGTPLEIVKKIQASSIVFDQCIQEGTWVHISFDPKLRKQVLTAHFGGPGGTTYTNGV